MHSHSSYLTLIKSLLFISIISSQADSAWLENFKIHNEEPTQKDEEPKKEDNPIGWYDSDGPQYNCDWYSIRSHCSRFGHAYENFGKTANQACHTCGGGTRIGTDTGISNGSTFKIKSMQDGNYIDTRGCRDGADVYYSPNNDNDESQRFYWGTEGQLYSKKCGKVIDIYGGACSDGTNLILWPAKSSGDDDEDMSNQRWKVNDVGEIVSLKCENMVIDHAASKNTVLLWTRHGKDNQQWEFV